MIAKVLERPEVRVEKLKAVEGAIATGNGVVVEIVREGQSRRYAADGATPQEVVKKVVEQVIADPYTAEWLPSRI